MKIQNPILRGYYPDPSVCEVDGMYYMVCSSFHHFPGVPLFKSVDCVNWEQIGHCLTRKSQLPLEHEEASGGIFAPTIRYCKGRFYMVTTHVKGHQNFYVWTDDIEGQWSDPIYVKQDGIDPSLYFEGDRCYFMSNGSDDEGNMGIVQCEINIETGEKLSPSKVIWLGTGGRYLESPHVYKINDFYYLFVAEGGTEYGHMITYARSRSLYGPYETYKNNPILTNRDKGGHEIQGVGHGELVQAPDGSYVIIHLGFRQIGQYDMFHHLGREVFISPVKLDEANWFVSESGFTQANLDLAFVNQPQALVTTETFQNTDWTKDWLYLRNPELNHYKFTSDSISLKGTPTTLNDCDSPSFIGIRQKEFSGNMSCQIKSNAEEAGLTIIMDEHHHYEMGLMQMEKGVQVFLRLTVGNISHMVNAIDFDSDTVKIDINFTAKAYDFAYVTEKGSRVSLGQGLTPYLSSEVAGGFTGVLMGLYCIDHSEDESNAIFKDFKVTYCTS